MSLKNNLKKSSSTDPFAVNRKARHDFTQEDTLEAGIMLEGSEVKSIRAGNIQLKEGYIHIRNDEVYLEGVYIQLYEHTGVNSAPSSSRTRKLLLHKREIRRLKVEKMRNGMSLYPIKVYEKNGKIKIQIGVGRGKKKQDKRESIKNRESQRGLERLHKRRK